MTGRLRQILNDFLGRAAMPPRTSAPAPSDGAVSKSEAAVARIVKARCATAGVFSIGATEIDPRHLAIWITTRTDRERDRLRADRTLEAALREAIAAAGYPPEAVPHVGFAFESQETVNRQHGGNWWSAVK
jgi:hypothetical protein